MSPSRKRKGATIETDNGTLLVGGKVGDDDLVWKGESDDLSVPLNLPTSTLAHLRLATQLLRDVGRTHSYPQSIL